MRKKGIAKRIIFARSPVFSKLLFSDTQAFNQCTVTIDVLSLQVIQHTSSLTNHHQQTSSGVVIVLVGLQMLSQLCDTIGQQCYLYFGRSGILRILTILCNDLSFDFLCDHDSNSS